MTRQSTSTFVVSLFLLSPTVRSFSVLPTPASSSTTALHMGLFDGVKDAFSAPTLERSKIDAERETPIDRWMGWSVASDATASQEKVRQAVSEEDFVDSMDAVNYVTVELTKPMGIVFEENDAEFGGIFVHSMKEDGVAVSEGHVQVGDQLVGVATGKVAGIPFDDALGTILESESDQVKLVFFRGTAEQLYGPTGASQAWLDDFIGVPKEEEASAEVAEES